MRFSSSFALFAFIVLAFGSPSSNANDWSGFRGPSGSGISAEGVLPERFDEGALSWRIPLGKGFSSPVVFEDRIFLTLYETLKVYTVSLSIEDGSAIWKTEAPEPLAGAPRGPNSPVASTPVVDDDSVYVFHRNFGMVAYDRLSGDENWRKPLGPFNSPHGMSTSPVMSEDLVFLQCDQDTESYLVALDKEGGEEIWRVERPAITHGYATPTVYRPEDGPVEIITSSSYQVCAYSAEDGEKLWWVEGMSWQSKAVPVIDREHLYVLSAMGAPSEFGAPRISGTWEQGLETYDKNGDGGIAKSEWDHPGMQQLWFIYDLDNNDALDEDEWRYAIARTRAKGGLFCIRLGGRGDVTNTHVRWTYEDRRGLPDIPSPLCLNGVVYLLKSSGILTSLDAESGEVLMQERIGEPDEYYASPIAASDRLVAASHSGELILIAGGREWKELSSHRLDEDVWATPAIAGGRLVVRSEGGLYCFTTEG